MPKVRIKTGLSNVNLPNGNTYTGGDIVSLTDEEYGDLAGTALGDEVLLVEGVVSLGSDNNDLRYHHFVIDLVDVADGDVLSFTPGYAGTIKSVRAVVDVPATTAAKAADLNLEIGSTNVTGGVVGLTSANCTPKGALVAGSAVTAANVFDSDDVVTVEAANTVTFVEGQIILEVLTIVTP